MTNQPPSKKVTLWPLVAITYFCTAGGPYGLETIVIAAGPLLSLLSLLIYPWLMSLPMALVTAELSSIFKPSDTTLTNSPKSHKDELSSEYSDAVGSVVWVEYALGRFAAFLCGMWSQIYYFLDQALYPVLFVEYLHILFYPKPEDGTMSPTVHFVLCFVMILFVVIVNLRGLEVVGYAAYILLAITLLPFFVLCIFGVPSVSPSDWFQPAARPQTINWTLFFSTLMWNGSGWDSVGSLTSETHDPQKTFPKAMMLAIALLQITYILPIAICFSVDNNLANWTDGQWERLALVLGGDTLKSIFLIGAAACCIGSFTALLSASSRELFYLSKIKLLPSTFETLHSHYKTPSFAIIFSAVVITSLALLPFHELLEVAINFNVCVQSLIFVSFIILRTRHFPLPNEKQNPVGERLSEADTFRVPLSTKTATTYLLVPLSICLFAFYTSSPMSKICIFASGLAGIPLYFACKQRTNVN